MNAFFHKHDGKRWTFKAGDVERYAEGCSVEDAERWLATAPPAAGAGPDVHLRYLLDAARSVELAAGRNPQDGPAGELASKALHLVACVSAVDHMCRSGDLPGEWRAGDKRAATGDEAA